MSVKVCMVPLLNFKVPYHFYPLQAGVKALKKHSWGISPAGFPYISFLYDKPSDSSAARIMQYDCFGVLTDIVFYMISIHL